MLRRKSSRKRKKNRKFYNEDNDTSMDGLENSLKRQMDDDFVPESISREGPMTMDSEDLEVADLREEEEEIFETELFPTPKRKRKNSQRKKKQPQLQQPPRKKFFLCNRACFVFFSAKVQKS